MFDVKFYCRGKLCLMLNFTVKVNYSVILT
jgi:hypothetical protein